ncbi:peptidoglycan amidohydrolase family protein [Fructobacillus evanidus]|uniref:NlpC_P60 family (NlpC) n=1 Tax=Fructobacillus evanidus TaxID=3064281 RepID=A0ABM9MM30_9LACO|nr:Cell wall-associated hydrolase [Fructobacillus sp. LMG 32999]CAK1222297.1 Cell wall-associated hydrolase [Fructobacillus sp. LMG 32999]CAK1225322.1 Cell wall-associated hydrolase [Fructobacillus sp. LMG 32999]CAK1225543.1 Cell wall-associated hydrolase [Fructobacillus sp. LMG 32999]CAK1225716.1 Cell wall-associated hydrolase [Fructobacillus sp. LMG 32999]
MAYNENTALAEARSYIGRATYSMDWDKRDGKQADGTTYFDCSGFVYHLLNVAGAIDDSYLSRSHYTGTLPTDLANAGFVEVDGDHVQAGDIYIWGANYGSGAGGNSHTGIFTSADNQISACYYTLGAKNGAVVELGHDYYWALDGKPEYHFYHYNGGQGASTPTAQPAQTTSTSKTSIQKFKDGKDKYVLDGWFTIQDVQQINKIWQVRVDELAKLPFDWTDNGIPCRVLENANGNVNFQPGDTARFKAPYSSGAIDEYDEAENAVGIDYISGYGRIWYDADKFWAHY